MNLSQVQAFYGLRAIATPTGTNISNDVQIGVGNTVETLTDSDVAYSLRAIFAGAGDELVLDLTTGSTTGSTAWVAGQPQIETATAAGTITASGNATVVVTAASMANSPKTISVAVTNGDTAVTWAGKVRTALAADADVTSRFSVGGTSTAIQLTRKPTTTFTVGAETVNLYAANDATVNISLANGTCTGITAAPTSANTQSGTVTDGVRIFDGDGKDFEGVAIPTFTVVRGLLMECGDEDSGVTVTGNSSDSFSLPSKGKILFSFPASASDSVLDSPYTFAAGDVNQITVTVIGKA